MLAPKVELCSPKLLRLARCRASGGCGHSAGVLAAGPATGILLLGTVRSSHLIRRSADRADAAKAV
jgi:hypothetical protein